MNWGSLRSKWFLAIVSTLVFLVFALEFTFDVTKEPVWQVVVLGIDFVLVFGFVGWLVFDWVSHKTRPARWLSERKVDVVLAFVVLILLTVPRLAGFAVIARLIGIAVLLVMDTPLGKRMVSNIRLRPSQTLALSFMGLIFVGTVLLMFPAATSDGQGASLLDALFTITSASCVTGLAVQDTGTYFTPFGQAVILMCIQVGGLGIMVLSATFAVLVGGRIPMRRQLGLGELLDVTTAEGLKSLMTAVATVTFVMELLGATFFFFLWWNDIPQMSDRVWWSVFYAVSAFNNAGFGLASDSVSGWVDNVPVTLTFVLLITAGGIGFAAIADLIDTRVWKISKPKAVWERLQIQTRIVLIATLLLDLCGMMIFLFLEYDGVLGELDPLGKVNAALFQAVAMRTTGFNSIQVGQIAAPTILFCVVWMFIGAAPGSTGGGIKTTTAAIGLATFRAMVRGREDVELMGRRVPPIVVSRSLSIIFIAMAAVVVFWMLFLATQDLPFERLLFETVSAFGTVGYSMDITTMLTPIGKVLEILLMFIGRVGPLTMALAIGERVSSGVYRYPEGRLAVG